MQYNTNVAKAHLVKIENTATNRNDIHNLMCSTSGYWS
jgi:hypothetical protein